MAKHIGVGGGVTQSASPMDYQHYETPACATRALIKAEGNFLPSWIWEPCAGKGAISRVLRIAGRYVIASDLLAYGGADAYIRADEDFLLTRTRPKGCRCIVSNFPYTDNDACIEHGLDLGCDVICLMRWAWAEGEDGPIRGSGLRSRLVDRHLVRVWLGVERLPMMHREGYQGRKLAKGAVPYAWFRFSPEEHPACDGFTVRRISWGE
jgi:hypothetical protein